MITTVLSSGTVAHHNGDFSGDILLECRDQSVTISFADLRALVIEEYRHKMIAEFESMSTKELVMRMGL